MELQNEELEKIYAETFKGYQEGAILKGKVLQVRQDGVIVDIGTKCEGFVPAVEFSTEEFNGLKQGCEIEVYLIKTGEFDDFVRLSKKQAVQIKTWESLEEAYHRGYHVEGEIVGKVKGGMKVEIEGVHAFLPGSQIDLKSLKNTDHLIGQNCTFKVINMNTKRSNVIVSRRLILEEQREKLREKVLSTIEEGAEIQGTVKNLTDYGAFIDLGGIDGLLHISDMSWGRISHPGELFRVGEAVNVVILKYDPMSERVTLGYKQSRPDPWTTVEDKYPPGTIITGKVINIVDYGIFIEIEEGLEGLVHVSEFDWLEKIKKPSIYFSVGDTVQAVVLQVNGADKRISMSIKQLKPNPWEEVKQKYSVGQKITGIIKNFTEFGAFINLEEGFDALLHISDISWNRHVQHPSEILKIGQNIEVVILGIDSQKKRVTVGLKELTPDPWIEDIPNKYKPGDQLKGKIARVTKFGLFVDLEGDVEGLLYFSEIDKKPEEKIDELFKVGDEVDVRIIKLDPSERKIGLSMKTGLDSEL
jgi:small subunit ribosomal protein S1